MSFDVKLTGVDEMMNELRMIDTKLARKYIKRAVTLAARIYKKRAKAHAKKSRDTGALYNSIDIKPLKRRNPFRFVSMVGPGYAKRAKWDSLATSIYGDSEEAEEKSGGRHGHLIEFGHKNRDGSWTPAQPFMRPAFKEGSAEMMKVIADEIERAWNE